MNGIPPSSARFVNDIVGRFDEFYYPNTSVEKITDRPSESDQELVQRNSSLPKDIQVMTYDYAPNISNWILSTGVLQRGGKDNEVRKAADESARNRLRSFGVVPQDGVSATRQLIAYVFTVAILNAHRLDKNRLLSNVVKNSIRETLALGLWGALYKIAAIFLKCGIVLAVLSVVAIAAAEYIGIIFLGGKLMVSVGLVGLPALIGVFITLIVAVIIPSVTLLFLLPRIRPTVRRWDRSLEEFEAQNKIKLIEKQIRRAAEVWVNLLLGKQPAANSSVAGRLPQ